jgi:hypothetical protein
VALLPDIIRRGIRSRLAGAAEAAGLWPRQTPSASFYFVDPLADLIGSRLDARGRPIRRLSPSLYCCRDAAVVIRYAGRRELNILARRRFARVYLLVDDDFSALKDNDGLPVDYRLRLLAYRDGLLRKLLAFVTHVVAPSERILSFYGHKRALQLHPAQCHQTGGLVHHRQTRHFDVVFAATRSHLRDLDFIAGSLAEFLKARPEARLTTFLNGHAPRVLQDLPNAIHLPMMGWQRYRAFVAENRFHAAVAPALDTDFNRARSFSRLHDHAAYGAAGIYSSQPPFIDVVKHGNSGLLLSNVTERWRDSLFELADRRDVTERLAAEGQRLSRSLGNLQRVRNFWLRELALA